MKTLNLAIITGGGITVAIIVFLIAPGFTSDKVVPHGLPTTPSITLYFNGSNLDQYPNNQFETRRGQNITLMVDVTSEPQNLPITLYTEPHIGFTATNGLDFKFSSIHMTTPGKVILYISASKDATPNKYRTRIFSSTVGMSLGTDIGIEVKQ